MLQSTLEPLPEIHYLPTKPVPKDSIIFQLCDTSLLNPDNRLAQANFVPPQLAFNHTDTNYTDSIGPEPFVFSSNSSMFSFTSDSKNDLLDQEPLQNKTLKKRPFKKIIFNS